VKLCLYGFATIANENRREHSSTGLGRKAEVRNRSIRVRGLAPSTQEAILQQLMEKHAAVKRVELFAEANEAIVELESPAVSVNYSTR
jgi:squamous cell carcinoma antigen recognized by T-cells 3